VLTGGWAEIFGSPGDGFCSEGFFPSIKRKRFNPRRIAGRQNVDVPDCYLLSN